MADAGPPARGAVIDDETVIAGAPLVVRRRVKWGEVDFARVAYTGRFLDWILEAAEVWFWTQTGMHWSEFDVKYDLSLPVVGCHLDFHRALRPYERIDLTVRVERIGTSSHTIAVVAHNEAGDHCFDGSLTFATVDLEAGTSAPMPAELVDTLRAYKAACED